MEIRKALVIGNARYSQSGTLRNPANDARAITAVLKRLDFAASTGIDLERNAMEDVLGDFERDIKNADVALLYYAGHGLQVNGHNYIIPVDADIQQEIHLKRRAFALDEILALMTRRATSSIVFLDACRDNPFARSLMMGIPSHARSTIVARSGLAEISLARGVFVAFATAPDHVADDGTGDNSPFTEAVLKYIEEPNVSISDFLINVRTHVLQATDGRQEPWDQSSLRTRFVFKPTEAPPPQVAVPPGSDKAQPETRTLAERAVLFTFSTFRMNMFVRGTGLGIASGLVTATALTFVERASELASGIMFGAALLLFLRSKLEISPIQAIGICASSFVVWLIAFFVTVSLMFPSTQEINSALADWISGPTVEQQRAAAGLYAISAWAVPIGGAIGATMESWALLIFPRFRSATFLLFAPLIGAISASAGMKTLNWFFICPAWQCAFFLLAAYELTRPRPKTA
jgi:Caspase domain